MDTLGHSLLARTTAWQLGEVSDFCLLLAVVFIKAETHYATHRDDKVVCAYFVAAICGTNSNQFEFARQIAATKIFTCHTRRFVAVTCRRDVSQRFVA